MLYTYSAACIGLDWAGSVRYVLMIPLSRLCPEGTTSRSLTIQKFLNDIICGDGNSPRRTVRSG